MAVVRGPRRRVWIVLLCASVLALQGCTVWIDGRKYDETYVVNGARDVLIVVGQILLVGAYALAGGYMHTENVSFLAPTALERGGWPSNEGAMFASHAWGSE